MDGQGTNAYGIQVVLRRGLYVALRLLAGLPHLFQDHKVNHRLSPRNETVKAPFWVKKSQISRIQFTRTDNLKIQSVKVLVPKKNAVCVLFTYPSASNDFSKTHVKQSRGADPHYPEKIMYISTSEQLCNVVKKQPKCDILFCK